MPPNPSDITQANFADQPSYPRLHTPGRANCQVSQFMNMRRVAYGSVRRISHRSSQSILGPCRVAADGPCSCPACSQSITAGGKNMNLCTTAYTTEGPQLAEESCTGSRSCNCRKCGAGAPHDIQLQINPLAGIFLARGILSQACARILSSSQGASSSNVQATYAYCSMTVSRFRKEQGFQSRAFSTVENYQSQVHIVVPQVSNVGLSMTVAKL